MQNNEDRVVEAVEKALNKVTSSYMLYPSLSSEYEEEQIC